MELKKGTEDPYKLSFFGPFKKVHDSKFATKFLDERNAFLFYIKYMFSLCICFLGIVVLLWLLLLFL